MAKILIVDDEINMLKSLQILFQTSPFYEVETATTGKEAIDKFSLDTDIAIIDLALPDMDGISVLKAIKEIKEETEVIIMTAYSSIKTAIESVKAGAFDYITKPFEPDELLIAVEKALQLIELKRENRRLKEVREIPFPEIIGRSKEIKEVMSLINKAAETDANVLIFGETGTGKELVAKMIHFKSKRNSGPYVPINCSALPETLIESEFFGYAKGAFTGAFQDKPGKLEMAHGGTLFLDEIGDMPLSMQAKFLRVIEEKRIQRLGDSTWRETDFRLISATNKSLEKLIKEGKFRDDLYYRIKVIEIKIPPLRERREDIPLLIDYYIQKKKAEFGISYVEISPEAYSLLLSYDYPGNVRELQNIIESALLISGGKIQKSHLSLNSNFKPISDKDEEIPLKNGWKILQETYRRLEYELLKNALEKYSHLSNAEIAKLLGTTRRVLELRMKFYGLTKKEDKNN
jgi:DNA-binding NtrC family response regulator